MLNNANAVLQKALAARVQAGHGEIADLLAEMATWVPEAGFPHNISPMYGPTMATHPIADEMGDYDPSKTVVEMVKLEAAYRRKNQLDRKDLPFFSETYLYEAIGKEDARMVLAFLGELARACGFDAFRETRKKKPTMDAILFVSMVAKMSFDKDPPEARLALASLIAEAKRIVDSEWIPVSHDTEGE